MTSMNRLTRYFAFVVGVAFIMAGVAGFIPFFTPPVPADAPHLHMDSNYGLLLGMFPVNTPHSIFHFSVGVFGVYAFRTYSLSRVFSRFLGVTLAILTIMGAIPQLHTSFGFFPLYGHDIWLHGLEAVIGLYLGFVAHPQDEMSKEKAAIHV